jgi:hypothetical protein
MSRTLRKVCANGRARFIVVTVHVFRRHRAHFRVTKRAPLCTFYLAILQVFSLKYRSVTVVKAATASHVTVKETSINQCIQCILYRSAGKTEVGSKLVLAWPSVAAGPVQIFVVDQYRDAELQMRYRWIQKNPFDPCESLPRKTATL